MLLVIKVVQQQFLFRLIVQFDHIGNQPAGVVTWTVELRNLKISSVDLKEMEFNGLYGFEFKIASFHLIQKNGEMIRGEFF